MRTERVQKIWAQLLAYVTGTVDQELLLRNEYLAAENRILKAQIKGRVLLSEQEKATLAEIAHRLGRSGVWICSGASRQRCVPTGSCSSWINTRAGS